MAMTPDEMIARARVPYPVVYCIDPGATTGYAIFAGGVLVHAGSCPPECLPRVPHDECVVEWPRQRSTGRASTASLIALGVHLGEALGRIGAHDPVRVDPSEWKGAVPKPSSRRREYIIATRCARLLDPTEPHPAPSEWDAWDAIGLGLVHTGRARRGVVR